MAKIKFTRALNRFFPDLKDMELEGNTVSELLKKVEGHYRGISDYILDESGALRPHINIFVKGELIEDRIKLQDAIDAEDEVIVFQALSGG